MALFVLRYVSNLMIFAIGLRAPGISSNTDTEYHTLDNGTTQWSRYHNVSHSLLH